MERRLAPPRREHGRGGGFAYATRVPREFLRIPRNWLHLLRHVSRFELVDQLLHGTLRHTQALGRCGMNAMTIAAAVEPGYVSRDQLALGVSERRRTAQKNLMKLDERLTR